MTVIKSIKYLALVILLFVVSGCALSRSVVPVEVGGKAANPITGIDVKIVSVTDKRTFEFRPKTPNIPSVSEDELNNDDIQDRAIARKRNGYGKALGDVLLPEGQTVATLITTSLTNGFRNAGYRVLEPDDPAYNAAIPIKADVIKFWTWVNMGFWQLTVENETEIILQGPIETLKNSTAISNGYKSNYGIVTDTVWQEVTVKSVESLSTKITDILKE